MKTCKLFCHIAAKRFEYLYIVANCCTVLLPPKNQTCLAQKPGCCRLPGSTSAYGYLSKHVVAESRELFYFFATKSWCAGCMYYWPKASFFCSKLCNLQHPNLLQDKLDFLWLEKSAS